MAVTLLLDRANGHLWRSDGARFDQTSRTWSPGAGRPEGDPVELPDAVTWLQRASGAPCKVPVGVVGPRQASTTHVAAAERLGTRLAECGLTVLCGGKSGVMAAVCSGVERAGGLSIGLLPDDDPARANPHVTVPIATGIGIARNAIIARAALCLVAIGGGPGTTAEMAFAVQFTVPVFALLDAPDVPGVHRVPDVDAALDQVARVVLVLAAGDGRGP